MILKPLIALVAASVLAMKLTQHLGRQQLQRRAKDDHQRQRDDVHRWEGEGGNLPPTPQR
ncbi:hypothetical protein ACG04Q_24100 [Roseateles sp. DXS20W]|uniref:DUF2897 family protein n=1 Tax=Pelomonas lactea TaxID=3299030 RepID=A0ABW7GRT4_9BURK